MVLEFVLAAHSEGRHISVLEIILLKNIASQATLHSTVKFLIEVKLLKTEICQADARRKYVTPTKLGISWLKDCSEILDSVRKK